MVHRRNIITLNHMWPITPPLQACNIILTPIRTRRQKVIFPDGVGLDRIGEGNPDKTKLLSLEQSRSLQPYPRSRAGTVKDICSLNISYDLRMFKVGIEPKICLSWIFHRLVMVKRRKQINEYTLLAHVIFKSPCHANCRRAAKVSRAKVKKCSAKQHNFILVIQLMLVNLKSTPCSCSYRVRRTPRRYR